MSFDSFLTKVDERKKNIFRGLGYDEFAFDIVVVVSKSAHS